MGRKAEILAHAADLLQKRGYTAFSYRDLSERLGIRKASIHHHFASKEALGEALLRQYATGFRDFCRSVEAPGNDAWTKLNLFFAHTSALCKEGMLCPAGSLQSQWDVLPEGLKHALRALDDRVRGWVAGVLQEGREAGAMQFSGDAEAQAVLVVSALQGALQNARAHGSPVLDEVIAQLARGMRRTD